MMKVVISFCQGITLLKFILHTNLVLIPKKEKLTTFSNLRLISLSNFLNKVISGIFHDRLERYMPNLISANQFGFLMGGVF